MRRITLLLLVLALSGIVSSQTPTRPKPTKVPAKPAVVLPDNIKAVLGEWPARNVDGSEIPGLKLTLRPDRTFRWQAGASVSGGRFSASLDVVELEFRHVDGAPQVPGLMRLEVRIATGQGYFVCETKSAPSAEAARTAEPERESIHGVWTLRGPDGSEQDVVRLILGKDKRFTWIGANFRSSGRYEEADGNLTFHYLEVDGAKVAPGSMKLTARLEPQTSMLHVDSHRYYRAGKTPPAPASASGG